MMFAMLGPFGDAIQFIFQERESQAGTVRVGGLGEMWELTWMHLKLSLAATAIACLVALPVGISLGHIGRLACCACGRVNDRRETGPYAAISFLSPFP
jgi:ABC-type proline/glycine betaine transport system permease subunit